MPRSPVWNWWLLAAVSLVAAGGCGLSAWADGKDEPLAARSGQAGGREAFLRPTADLPRERRLDWQLGRSIFRKLWVPSPASTKASDGLGPLFNARSCFSCHAGNGRGRPLQQAGGAAAHFSLVLRFAGTDNGSGSRAGDPVYGRQLQMRAATGLAAEASVGIDYDERQVTLADGEVVSLRAPRYRIDNWSHGAPAPAAALSPRIAPPMIGLGLLEAIPDEAILALADPDDADGDGVSGRRLPVWSKALQRESPGRFGWKAEEATVADQSAAALSSDMGLSNPLIRLPQGDCTSAQSACLGAADGGTARDDGLEIGRPLFDRLVHYVRNIDVPPRRDADRPDVQAGERLFAGIGCALCHRPQWTTGATAAAGSHLAKRTIYPYTDLLLHDMGQGLADAGGSELAREWRTPALWGIGLTRAVGGAESYLHDGRARTVTEAVLWHDGEARMARDAFARLTRADRERLLAFVKSL